MKLYYHPISAYSQKVLMAFHEKGVAFEPVIVSLMDPDARTAFKRDHNRLGKLPFLRDEAKDAVVPESSIIIEYIDRHCSGPKLIPDDPDLARRTRFLDRFFDNYMTEPMTKIFFDGLRPADKRDPYGVDEARKTLDNAYAIANERLSKQPFALGDAFTMADCAAAPALFYLQKVHPYGAHAGLSAYAKRLHERPSFQRIYKEAEPYLAKMMGSK